MSALVVTANTWVILIGGLVTILGSGAAGAVAVKILSRPVDAATAAKLRAEAKQLATETAAKEVGLLRDIIQEVRKSEADKVSRITRLEEARDADRKRLDKLEERERHMLTRAAVHEAWDQMAFAALLSMNPNHPPPPPLLPPLLSGRQHNPAAGSHDFPVKPDDLGADDFAEDGIDEDRP